jgi:hypothetical protein
MIWALILEVLLMWERLTELCTLMTELLLVELLILILVAEYLTEVLVLLILLDELVHIGHARIASIVLKVHHVCHTRLLVQVRDWLLLI